MHKWINEISHSEMGVSHSFTLQGCDLNTAHRLHQKTSVSAAARLLMYNNCQLSCSGATAVVDKHLVSVQ